MCSRRSSASSSPRPTSSSSTSKPRGSKPSETYGVHVTSPRKFPRTARVNEVMLEVLADELERMSDPRLELVTFTGVKVTRDLSYATVYYSTLGAEVAPDAPTTFAENADEALRKAAAHLRGVVGR